MSFFNRLFSALRDTGRNILFWLLVLIGGGLLVLALRGTGQQPAPLSPQPVHPLRPGRPTPPPPPTTVAESGFPDITPFPSPVSPPVGATMTGRREGLPFPTVTPPDFNPAHLTQSPTPAPPPTRTPVVPHAHDAFGLVGVSASVGSEPEAIIAGSTHLFVLAENTLISLTNNNPVAPAVAGQIPLPEKENIDISHLALAGDTLLVAHQEAGLVIVEVTDPAGMRVSATYHPPGLADQPETGPRRVVRVVVEGDQAYVFTEFCPPGCPGEDTSGVVDVLDISDPAGPTLQTRIPLVARDPEIAVQHPYLFVGAGDGRIHIWVWSGDELVRFGEPVQLTYADGAPAPGVDSLQPAPAGWLNTLSNGVWWTILPDEAGWHIAQGPVELHAHYDGGMFLDGLVLLLDSHLGGLRLIKLISTATMHDLGAYGPAWGLSKTGYTQHFALMDGLIYALDGNGSINVLQIQAP